MKPKITPVDVWASEIRDQPGGLAAPLKALRDAGANLDFVIARRQPDRPGTGVVFLAPVAGSAASAAGLTRADGLHAVRIEMGDKPGLGATITQAVADAGINMRGLSAAAVGGTCVVYLAFDNDRDAAKAREVLGKVLA